MGITRKRGCSGVLNRTLEPGDNEEEAWAGSFPRGPLGGGVPHNTQHGVTAHTILIGCSDIHMH